MSLPCPSTVLEAESIGVREALSWVMDRGDKNVIVESDSLLTVNTVGNKHNYLLEVGYIIDWCREILQLKPTFSIPYVRKQANKIAHGLSKLPCSIYCSNVISSPPTHPVETLLKDLSD